MKLPLGLSLEAKLLRQNKIKLQIWDTVNGLSFLGRTISFPRNYKRILSKCQRRNICYDFCNQNSFDHVTKWLEQTQLHGPSHLNLILVGNKSDREGVNN